MALSVLDLLSEYIFYEKEDYYVVEKKMICSTKRIEFLKSNFVRFQYKIEEQEESNRLFLHYRKNGKTFKINVFHDWMRKEVKNKIIKELDWHVPFR